MDTNVETFLAHHGVKGMKWGVINEDKPTGSSGTKSDVKTPTTSKVDVASSTKSTATPKSVGSGKTSSTKNSGSKKLPVGKISSHEKAVLDKMGLKPEQADSMAMKYGPESMKKAPKKLTRNQKALLIGGGVALLGVGLMVGGTYYNYNKMMNALNTDVVPDMSIFKKHIEAVTSKAEFTEGFKNYWKTSFENSGKGLFNFTKDDIAKLSTEPLSFEPGSIFKRVSMVAENEVKETGFFAAFTDTDVNRYKAALPIYWKLNGTDATEGFVVSLKAKAAIKAPSMRESYDIWEDMVKSGEPIMGLQVHQWLGITPEKVKSLGPQGVAMKTWKQMAGGWNNEYSPISAVYFEKVKKRGYNALIDANDAGSISDRPMRFLDGTMFSIDGHEPLTSSAIKMAQDNIVALAHKLMMIGEAFYLLHVDRTHSIFGRAVTDGDRYSRAG